MRVHWFFSLALMTSTHSFAFCFEEAASRYGVNASLLRAIAVTESSMRPDVESPTRDIGLMGINRSWLPKLAKEFGLMERDVWEPCTNVHIGAWILASNFRQFGVNWEAVGAYAAACTKLKGGDCVQARYRYSKKVWTNLQRF